MTWLKELWNGPVESITVVTRKITKYDVALAKELDAGLVEDYKIPMPDGNDPIPVPGSQSVIAVVYGGSFFTGPSIEVSYVNYEVAE